MFSWLINNPTYLLIGSGVCIAVGMGFKAITEVRLRKQKAAEDAAEAEKTATTNGKKT